MIAAVISDQTCIAWQIEHTHYSITSQLPIGEPFRLAPMSFNLTAKVVFASAIFGLVSYLFAELVHGLHEIFKSFIPWSIVRPIVGGLIVIALMLLFGTRDYLGLGVSSTDPSRVTIVSSFSPGGANDWSWLLKLLFTVVTLSSGFKGGEVTPLFFIGAALGNTLAVHLGAPIDLFAGIGFVAVFAGATNTPLACTWMAIELFGAEYSVYFAIANFTAYRFSGHSGIYLSQRIGKSKLSSTDGEEPKTLREMRALFKDRAINQREQIHHR